jgi:hypothetical protein
MENTILLNSRFSKKNWVVEHNIYSSSLFNKKTNKWETLYSQMVCLIKKTDYWNHKYRKLIVENNIILSIMFSKEFWLVEYSICSFNKENRLNCMKHVMPDNC